MIIVQEWAVYLGLLSVINLAGLKSLTKYDFLLSHFQ